MRVCVLLALSTGCSLPPKLSPERPRIVDACEPIVVKSGTRRDVVTEQVVTGVDTTTSSSGEVIAETERTAFRDRVVHTKYLDVWQAGRKLTDYELHAITGNTAAVTFFDRERVEGAAQADEGRAQIGRWRPLLIGGVGVMAVGSTVGPLLRDDSGNLTTAGLAITVSAVAGGLIAAAIGYRGVTSGRTTYNRGSARVHTPDYPRDPSMYRRQAAGYNAGLATCQPGERTDGIVRTDRQEGR
jgi:hypothetical protein